MINIFIDREKLSDGSYVFTVRIGNATICAYDEREAQILADKLCDAIVNHSCELVGITDTYTFLGETLP